MTYSSKSNFLLNNIPSSFLVELLLIVSFLIFNASFSWVFISRWHLSGLAFKKLFENQWKSLSIFFFEWFNYFIKFKIIGMWSRAICIICKVYIDIIKEQITKKKKKKLKKRGPDIDPCGTPDSTLLYSLNEELILTLWIRLVK